MEQIRYIWTDGSNKDFQRFYLSAEEYYSSLVGGVQNRLGFIPYNISDSIGTVLVTYIGDIAVGCAGLKAYSETDAEIKRIWVEPDQRRKHIAEDMMKMIEEKARQSGFRRTVLQTREAMREAVLLYEKLGYLRIENYPPYDKLDGAVCFAKEL
ncbi:GNAT family N-acetyltransferase [Ruminococcus flavefaciens]|uniref:GNAT family N-acetyltransferase n=1 Tax=Ruminococcus flavefaciens TaxID=1265 RepID=UPI0026EA4D17|nr:GNAT family N-acetyltransferase [Ruminococcus flavefaciens]